MQWAYVNGKLDKQAVFRRIAHQGNADDIKTILKEAADGAEFLDSCFGDLRALAVEYHHMTVLQFLATYRPPELWPASICSRAAALGQLDVLNWARSMGCPWARRDLPPGLLLQVCLSAHALDPHQVYAVYSPVCTDGVLTCVLNSDPFNEG